MTRTGKLLIPDMGHSPVHELWSRYALAKWGPQKGRVQQAYLGRVSMRNFPLQATSWRL